jgi:hypothetical protein
MDILTHALSGTAMAACAMNYVPAGPLRKFKIIVAGTTGGIFPDLDAISLWSRFDGTFGKLFGLEHAGKVIYGSKFWYSHHAFFHSVAGSIIFGLMAVLLLYLLKRLANREMTFHKFCRDHIIYFAVFVLGFWAHLAGDLPTPASVWGGIDLLWPSEDYAGGYGKIWWWNNYDIFLLIVCCVVLNLAIPAISGYIRKKAKVFTSCVLIVAISLILFQINSRHYDYAYSGNTSEYAEFEQNSKEEQQRILGKKLYRCMERFDNLLKFYF